MSVYRLYIDKESFVHRLNPVVKMVWFATIVLLAWSFNKWEYALVVFLWALVYPLLSKLPFRRIFGASFLFVVWTAILSLLLWPMFLQGGNVVYEWSVFRFTDIGLSVAISYSFRVGACMVAALSWLMTTSQRELIEGLSDVRVPYHLSFGIMLALRYAPVLLGEIGRVREAQKSRAFNWNRGSLKRRFQAFGENARVLVVPVFNRMLTSVNQIALCLDSKGCDFSRPPKRREIQLTRSDKAFLAITLAVTAFFVALRILGYGWISMLA